MTPIRRAYWVLRPVVGAIGVSLLLGFVMWAIYHPS
jgi:hypothetical protein